MKKFLLAFSFLVMFVTINSCRQDDTVLSNDDITNLRIIQDTRFQRTSNNLNARTDSGSVVFKVDEKIRPPR